MRTEYYDELSSSFAEACNRADAQQARRFRVVTSVNGASLAETPRRFQLVPFNQLNPGAASPCLVKGLIPRVGIAAIWGPPKCGKSFWTFDLAMHSALGWQYRGRRVIAGTVVYCAFEGAEGFKARAAVFRQHHNVAPDADVPFFLMPTRMDLVRDHEGLIASIQEQSHTPVLVVLDTLNRSIRGSESSDEDMTAYLNAADAIRGAFECAVIIVHHCGVDGTRPRGHTSLTGTVDAQLAVKRDAADNVLVTVEHMKDGPEGDVIASRLERVELSADEDGDPIASCVIVPVEANEVQASKINRRLSDRQSLALTALSDAALDSGKAAPIDWQLPAGIQIVSVDAWRNELMRKAVIDREGANPRQEFKRLRDQLAARKLIGVRDDFVWRA
jgi:AAA domain-containing protein